MRTITADLDPRGSREVVEEIDIAGWGRVTPSSGSRLTMRVEEAAGLLGISRGLAYELVNRGELPALRLGRRIVVPVSALEDLVASAGNGPDTAQITDCQTPQAAGNGSRSTRRRRSRTPAGDDNGGRLPLDGLGRHED